MGTAPAHSYRVRTSTVIPGGLSVAKFCEVLSAVATLKHGLVAAIHLLAPELASRGGNLPVAADLLRLGRAFLELYEFESSNENVVSDVNQVAKRCLVGAEAHAAAAVLAHRLAVAMDDYRSSAHAYGGLACTLLHLQPAIALDPLLMSAGKGKRFAVRSRLFYREGQVLQCARVDALLAWVAISPEERAVKVAGWITLVERVEKKASAVEEVSDSAPVRLSGLASQLLNMVKEKTPVLTALAHNFYPTHDSGRLEAALAPCLSVLHQMGLSADAEVAAWAADSIASVKGRIQNHRARESLDERSFE